MKDTDKLVCVCFYVTTEDVEKYLKVAGNAEKPLDVKLRELKIAQGCRLCKYEDDDRIDVHYSKLLGKH
jgi:hypothetical protein